MNPVQENLIVIASWFRSKDIYVRHLSVFSAKSLIYCGLLTVPFIQTHFMISRIERILILEIQKFEFRDTWNENSVKTIQSSMKPIHQPSVNLKTLAYQLKYFI